MNLADFVASLVDILLPNPHGEFDAVPKACHTVRDTIFPCSKTLLETNVRNLYVAIFPIPFY